MEGVATAQKIKVQFMRTQNPFTLMLYPVSHREAVERFHVDNFIFDPPQTEAEMATAGKICKIFYVVPFKTYTPLTWCSNKKTCTLDKFLYAPPFQSITLHCTIILSITAI